MVTFGAFIFPLAYNSKITVHCLAYQTNNDSTSRHITYFKSEYYNSPKPLTEQ